jgi:hypothetical protein
VRIVLFFDVFSICDRFWKEGKRAMFRDPLGPIESFDWGSFVIRGSQHTKNSAGKIGAGKDVRVLGEEVTAWKERKGHSLTPAMIVGVFGREVETLIIGAGVYGALECPAEVRDAVRDNGIAELIVAKTPDACRTYNALFRKGRRVALLAHGTC